MRSTTLLTFSAALMLCRAAVAHERHLPRDDGAGFPVPPPGSYRLPPIKPAAGGAVTDEAGRRQDLLLDALRGKVSILALIYTRCTDLCPLSNAGMARLQDLAAKDPVLSRRMRLVTLSFDPEHDTPEVMRDFAAAWRSAEPAAPAWTFLTPHDREALGPILAAYGQRVYAKPDGALSHVFRAFLIDPAGLVRNIYSLDFFEPALVLSDVRTLLLEEPAFKGSASRRAP
ncbi:SCO family protein [Methylobacterium planeticum]|uniref:SCO family protein n=1 Tax=Methylobacterium planeticum TaxID=2615211 RepID=A0A6N6MRV9_9HYPH|nr:SCO family protein [Methylobacterium planeticum]KAB1072977.1 SCO family protein [Methylobacterium planeticum]